MTFRLKLLLAMMLLVVGVTATTLWMTSNQVRLSYERHFQQSFRAQVDSFLQQREARLEPVKARVAAAADSVRLVAAMENAGQPHRDQQDVDDLYQNGIDQLAEVIAGGPGNRAHGQGGFFCFLNTRGEILEPSVQVKLPFGLAGLRRIAAQVEAVGLAASRDNALQVGYLASDEAPGILGIREMVFTPILDQVSRQKLGVLGVGFPLPAPSRDNPILSALWLDHRLYASSIPAAALPQVEQAVAAELRADVASRHDLRALVGAVPQQVYCEALSAGSAFPVAYQVCLYSLAEATTEKRLFERKIVVSGSIALLCALGLSWLISRSLAVPVHQLVKGTSEIERGNYRVKVAVGGRDELGRLGQAFNDMTERLEAARVAQEQRLAERTQELVERKRAEDALRKSEASLREAQRIAHLGNWDWQVPSNELGWSDEVYAIFGLERGQFGATYEAFLERVHPADRDKVGQAVRQSLAQAAPYSVEHRVVRPDGQVRIVREQAEVVREANGQTVRMFGTIQDITDQKRIEAEFLRAQRLDSVGALAGGMAHDLNNALSPILMGIQLIRRQVKDPETQQMLTVMETNTHRGADMVRQVLTFARGREGERELLHVGRLVREMENIVRQTLPKTINVSALVPPDLWPVLGNSTQLHQVLLNLCINARDAMPKGGELALAADNVELTAEEAQGIPSGTSGQFVMLLVSDTGTGIPPEILPRLFQPFFTTKEPGKGTGLGLSTIARIVRNHGGFVGVESEVGVGTTFEIYFPRGEPAPAPQPTPADLAGRPVPGQGELILFVDDDRSAREMVTPTLAEHGYRVLCAANGAEALALLSLHKQEVRLVLTDVAMPVMDGMELLARLRSGYPGLPLILMSGSLVGQQALPEGATAFLQKPFQLEQFLHAITGALHP